VAGDLGPWPPEQATVLVDVLQRAGLTPEAKRTREGIQVRVPEDQADQAHQILVANMDVIAQAARTTHERGARRKARTGRGEERQDRGSATPLASERLTRLAMPLGLLIVGLTLAMIVRPLTLPLIVFTVAGVIYLLGKQTQRDGDEKP
jgi:Flp pilus assembly protein TadB